MRKVFYFFSRYEKYPDKKYTKDKERQKCLQKLPILMFK